MTAFLAATVASPPSHHGAYLPLGLCLLAGLVILWHLYRGWCQGAGRTLFNLFAVIGACLAAWWFSDILARGLEQANVLPVLVPRLIAPLLILGSVWVALRVAGRMLFSRTADKPAMMDRLAHGLSGMAVGLLASVVWLAALAIALSALGYLAGNRLSYPPTLEGYYARGLTTLADARELLVTLPGGAWLATVQPEPPKPYRVTRKLMIVLNNPAMQHAALGHKDVKLLLSQPAVQAVVEDPEVYRLSSERDIRGLLNNPSIQAALHDPEVKRILHAMDFEDLLDAIIASQPSQSPSPSQ